MQPTTLPEVQSTLELIAKCADAEATYVEETFYANLAANRIRGLVLDLKTVAQLLGLSDLVTQIQDIQKSWPNPYFDDEGNPTTKSGKPLNDLDNTDEDQDNE